MTPVDQEFLHDPPKQNGDCLRAIVASLLDLPLSEVPHFCAEGDGEGWFLRLGLWLQARGLCVVPLLGPQCIDAFHIAAGPSRRGVRHAVVMRNGRVVHDPHPTREGIESVDQAFLFVPIKDVISKIYPPVGDR
jgi:hypothetical protein